MRSIGFPELAVILVFGLGGIAFVFFLWGRIFSKAGYSGWLCLTQLVPLVNIIVLGWFAFAEWPVTRELSRLRHASAGNPRPSDWP